MGLFSTEIPLPYTTATQKRSTQESLDLAASDLMQLDGKIYELSCLSFSSGQPPMEFWAQQTKKMGGPLKMSSNSDRNVSWTAIAPLVVCLGMLLVGLNKGHCLYGTALGTAVCRSVVSSITWYRESHGPFQHTRVFLPYCLTTRADESFVYHTLSGIKILAARKRWQIISINRPTREQSAVAGLQLGPCALSRHSRNNAFSFLKKNISRRTINLVPLNTIATAAANSNLPQR